MKKLSIALLTTALLTACDSESSAAVPEDKNVSTPQIHLTDVIGHWAEKSIQTAIQKKYVDGYEDSTFKPDNKLSRAEFLKMVITASKESVSGDTTGANWYKPYVTTATNDGILSDTDFPVEDINKPITRLEMSRIALRAVDKKLQNKNLHMDDNSVMYNSAKKGIIQGLNNGALEPSHETTRAQSVTIIERVLTLQSGGSLEVDKYAVANAELSLKKTNIFTVMPHIFGGDQSVIWNPDNLSVETGDGLFKGTMDQIVAIDLGDPNDPNLSLLGDISKLKWHNGRSVKTSQFVKDGYMDSYVLYFKGHVDYNKDTSIYKNTFQQPNFTLYGFKHGEPTDGINGILSSVAPLFNNIAGDVPALIISKKSVMESRVAISISAPAIPPAQNYSKMILSSLLPQK